ncbi:ribonuclease H-like domain-containing protein [Tanacetum coccineum]
MTHPHPKENFVPKAVLMKSGIKSLNTTGQNFSKAAVSVNTARPINTTYTRPTVNSARKASNVLNKAHTHVKRPFNKSITNKNNNLKEKVNIVKGDVTTVGPKAVVSNNIGNEANDVKDSACWVWRPKQKGNPQLELQEKGVIDSGCSRHMTGNKSYLSDYEEIDGGFVAFRGDPKGGRITSKGKISTGKLDFEDVYFVKELKFNLFSVSQMCDKKNSVLFTDTECVVLSPDFKLLDENHVLLRVPRKDNMYSVDLKNIVPSRGLTCLLAKDTLDESNLCHRRLGHINFKTLNKLVRGNLVRGIKPALSFMRPFGCPATILNTLDHLGKFDGKADEGFFVGSSTNSKAYRIDEHVKAEKDDDPKVEEMKKHMEIVQDEEEIAIDSIPLAIKPQMIVEYKIVKEEQKGFYHLIRANGIKHGINRPVDEYERVLWGDLKVMFEPDIKSDVWRNLQGYKVTIWKLFDNCGVHFIQKMNIKFRGGLLGLKDFKMILRVTTAQSNTTAKLPILKLGEYEIWVIRIKQYFEVQDYAPWEVIKNGNSWVSVPQTTQENGTSVSKMLVPVTTEEKTNKKNNVKARSLLYL